MTSESMTASRRWRLARVLLLILTVLPPVLALIFIANYRLSVPYGDEWRQDAPVALSAAAGKLTWAQIFEIDDGHRVIFTNGTVALASALLHWPLKLESLLNFALIVGQAALLLAFFRQSLRDKRGWLIAAALFSLLIFNLSRKESWLTFRHSHYTFGALFILLAVYATSKRWPLLAVLALCACASFATSSGLLVWPLVILSLLLRGDLTRQRALALIASAVVVAALYLTNSGIGIGARLAEDESRPLAESNPVVQIGNVGDLLTRLTATVSAAFFDPDEGHALPIAVTVIAFGLGLVNLAYLRRGDGSWRGVASWMVVAGYGLGAIAMISLGRPGLDSVIYSSQYVSVAAFLWIALAALLLRSLARLSGERGSWQRALLVANSFAVIGIVALFARGDWLGLTQTETYWERPLSLAPSTELKPAEECVLDYRYTRETDCLKSVQVRRGNWDMIDRFAAYRLALFAEQRPTLILPPEYQPGETVIVSTDGAWKNLHVRDWLLNGVPDETLWSVVLSRQVEDAFKLDTPRPLRNIMASQGATLPNVDGPIWYIYEADANPERVADIARPLADAGYTAWVTNTLPAPLDLVVSGYRQSEAGH